jgi:GNAT superfamily N-acetyltransferase
VEITPVRTDAERQLSLDVYNAVFPEWAAAIEDVVSWEEGTIAHASFLAWRDGELAGSAHVAEEGHRTEPNASIYVLEHYRGSGVGSRLLGVISRWAGERGHEWLRGEVGEADRDSLAWADSRGFAEIGRDSLLVLDLSAVGDVAVDPPPGVGIVSWAERPELARGMYEVAVEAYPDIPGNEDDRIEPFDDWLAHDMGGSGDRPEATFVAVAGDEVVGYAKFHLTTARPTVAYHDITGVKRAWRGKGIAHALKAAEIAWAKEKGYERLETLNEQRNEPIRRLNERWGYRLAPGRIALRGPVAPSVGS